jgi:hypothetical protein
MSPGLFMVLSLEPPPLTFPFSLHPWLGFLASDILWKGYLLDFSLWDWSTEAPLWDLSVETL